MYDIVIVGGGSAGMAAAISAYDQGIKKILLLEVNNCLGGILQQCIHNGFGLQIFHEELSGPAFAQKVINELHERKIEYKLNTSVIAITEDKEITYVNEQEGYKTIKAKAIIFATGCYERNRGAINLNGVRCKGVYTAGSAQKYLNIENILVGKKVLILGSGDIGLIMARRMTLEGAKVVGVVELMPYSNGLTRNIIQCLNDYDIPLYLSHTIKDIDGKDHVEQVTIVEVDKDKNYIAGSEKIFDVDTILLSVGLLPEISLANSLPFEISLGNKSFKVDQYNQTNILGYYACGNALHVHDLVDFVYLEAKTTGINVAKNLMNQRSINNKQEVVYDDNIAYVIPQVISYPNDIDITFSFRVKKPFSQSLIEIYADDRLIKKINKNQILCAEMERILVKKEMIPNNAIISIKVRENYD